MQQQADGRFARLMTPGRIGSLELRNRIVMCPMGVLFGNEDGSVSENEAAFYEVRARGGAALLLIGTACVAHPRGTNGCVQVTRDGGTEQLAADTVIGIAPATPESNLADALGSAGKPVHAIGDCSSLGFIEGATNGALMVARSIG